MLMYGKLFASLYQGTMRGRSDEILVFTNLIAHADQYGIVDKHWKAICEETGLTQDAVKAALINLEAPDLESRSPEQDGRRIVRLDEHRAWGWQIVNYLKYRAIRNEEDRREQNRLAQERWRNRHKPSVSKVSLDKPQSAQGEGEVKARKSKAYAPQSALSDVSPNVVTDWLQVRKAKRAAVTETAIKGMRAEAEKAGMSLEAVLRLCCERGWAGFKASWVQGEKSAKSGNGSGAPWWASNEGIQAKAAEVGVQPRSGESWADLKARVNAAMESA